MQRPWLRSLAEHHCPMLVWLAGVAIATICVTLVLWSAVHAAAFALLAVPLLLLAGLAAALAELVQAYRWHSGDLRSMGIHAIGTVGLGMSALPLTTGLAFATMWIADCTTIMRSFPAYQQIVTDVQRGTIMPSDGWQKRDNVQFITEARPNERIVFRLADVGYRESGLVYDPTGAVLAADRANLSGEDPPHHIGHATVQNCHAALITTYYRCDIWVLGDD
jgi:hypothetical protein